jgi:hypothetical protein
LAHRVFLSIYFAWIKLPLQKDFLAGGGQFAEETGLVTHVATSQTLEIRLDKQSVVVAIHPDFTNQ